MITLWVNYLKWCVFNKHVDVFIGAIRINTATMKLPLKLIVKPVPPVKNANHKLTLDTNKPPANLNDIFPGKNIIIRGLMWENMSSWV